jgi:hypothetical protein
VQTANLIFDTCLKKNVEALDAGEPIGAAEIAHNRMMAAYMMRLSKQAVERLCSIYGSRWIFDGHPLQVILRDTLAGATHRSYNWESVAREYSLSIGLARSSATPIGA